MLPSALAIMNCDQGLAWSCPALSCHAPLPSLLLLGLALTLRQSRLVQELILQKTQPQERSQWFSVRSMT